MFFNPESQTVNIKARGIEPNNFPQVVSKVYQKWTDHFFGEPNGRKRGLKDAERRALSVLLRDLDALGIPRAELGSSDYPDMGERCKKVVGFFAENHPDQLKDWLTREMIGLERMMSRNDPRISLIIKMAYEELQMEK